MSDAEATYVSTATIELTATDADSGVADTFYVLDGGVQVTGTSISVTALGAHTLEFWSVDVAGNVEARNTASFTVTAPPVPSTDLYTVKTHVPSRHTLGRVATLTNKVTGETYTAVVGKRGVVTFTDVPAGTYKLSVATRNGTKTLRTIKVPMRRNVHDNHDNRHDRNDRDNHDNHDKDSRDRD